MRALLAFLQGFHLRAATLDALLLQHGGLVFLQRVERIEEARGGKAQRSGSFASGPHIDETMQRVFALLDALLVADGAGLGALGAAEALALVPDDGFDCREQLGGGHQADRNARAAEDSFNNFAVVVVWDDNAVLDGVSAHDAAGRDLQIENRIAGRRELVNELLGRRSAIECALVAFFEDDDATALDARIF